MIVSHKHRFIFLKTNKTAGTSVEMALSSVCGPEDIISRISRKDEEQRKRLGYRGKQNYWVSPLRYNWAALKWFISPDSYFKGKFYNHMPARELRELISPKVWSTYYKFCFERNPWDRVVSLYYFACRTEPRMPFTDFVHSDALLTLKERGRELYCIDGQVVVDRICRFESLQEDLDDVCRELDLPCPLPLPHAKSGFRKDRSGYRALYSDADRERVYELFRPEIEQMNYRF